MQTDAWLAAACADADRRGLSDLKPLLETLARSTAALRKADDEHAARAAGAPPAPAAGPLPHSGDTR
jgi:hypothetical protein